MRASLVGAAAGGARSGKHPRDRVRGLPISGHGSALLILSE